jgi:hypothetical protein
MKMMKVKSKIAMGLMKKEWASYLSLEIQMTMS